MALTGSRCEGSTDVEGTFSQRVTSDIGPRDRAGDLPLASSHDGLGDFPVKLSARQSISRPSSDQSWRCFDGPSGSTSDFSDSTINTVREMRTA